MIQTLVGIVILLIIVGVVWWGVMQLLPLLTPYLPAPIVVVIRVLLVVILVLIVVAVLANLFGVGTHYLPGTLRW